MQRRIATIPVVMAMLMVMITSVVPHHHHQTIACFVKEVCVEDGCCNDRHTAHSDADPEENESHCVAHEEYFQADDLRLDSIGAVSVPVAVILRPMDILSRAVDTPCLGVKSFSPFPLLSWRINC